NSQIHDRAAHRIKHLEQLLGFRPASPAIPPQGMFSERGQGGMLVGLLQVKHDRALAMIYGVVLAAWTSVIIAAGADWPAVSRALSAPWVKAALHLVLPLAVAIATAEEIARHGGQGREPALVYTLGDLAKELGPDTED